MKLNLEVVHKGVWTWLLSCIECILGRLVKMVLDSATVLKVFTDYEKRLHTAFPTIPSSREHWLVTVWFSSLLCPPATWFSCHGPRHLCTQVRPCGIVIIFRLQFWASFFLIAWHYHSFYYMIITICLITVIHRIVDIFKLKILSYFLFYSLTLLIISVHEYYNMFHKYYAFRYEHTTFVCYIVISMAV